MFSSSAAGRAASLSLGISRNRDDGLPSWRDVGLAAHVQTSPVLPSKNEIGSAKVPHLARDGGPYGTITGSVTVDMATVPRRKRERF
jgi:hypothetical protein